MAVILSVTLMVLDYRFERVDGFRQMLSSILTPIQWLSDLPQSMMSWGGTSLKTREQLLDENDALQVQIAVLERKVQKLVALAVENNRLRELLNASSQIDDSVIVAELIGINPDPFVHQVMLNKGNSDGVQVGQAVLDSNGLMGQVIEVSELTSRVLLISDTAHAVPVQASRNGVRAIAVGKGSIGELELANVPDTADIREGDLLISSGLGGRFPAGYPVAEVASVRHDPGQPFASVLVRPSAKLNQSRLVLIVFKGKERSSFQKIDSELESSGEER
ncbi:MAG: rod shape-determining protein MreC [Pseudomonadales bacterium]|uniref:Cell shape-determining protein MreC n=2 Tax=Oleiphilus messinensis TaxID=141451 RepID=A0A1Y0I948_9GAMM|nr:rod shape-determining protein MreC [Oleiphilus messinensis]MCG8612761.1 rod shape-determining protein MreC [Pseudomonadales bacterium]